MRKIAIVAEGYGDVAALPSLASRTARAFGYDVYAAHTVRADGWVRLRQPGQLERYCQLAGSHPELDAVVVVMDLDDGCAKEEATSVVDRIATITNAIKL